MPVIVLARASSHLCRACLPVRESSQVTQLALSQLGTDTRDRCAAARMGTSKKQKEATVPAVTATLAPDVRVTVRKELLRRVNVAIFWFTTLSILVGAALLIRKGLGNTGTPEQVVFGLGLVALGVQRVAVRDGPPAIARGAPKGKRAKTAKQ